MATPSDIASGNYDEKEFFVFKEEDPTAGAGGTNRWQDGINAWLSTQGDDRYHPPSDYCGTSNPVNVEFINPKDRQSNLPNEFTIEVRADSTANIIQIELEIDGVKKRTFTGPPFNEKIELENGVHEIRAKARDDKGNESDRTITIGVNVAWNFSPTPSPSPAP